MDHRHKEDGCCVARHESLPQTSLVAPAARLHISRLAGTSKLQILLILLALFVCGGAFADPRVRPTE